VARLSPGYWAVPLVILSLGMANVLGPLCSVAAAQQSTSSESKSWTESITSPFKQGFDKLGRALNPKPSASVPGIEDDAVSLKGKAKPGPELFVAVARLYEQAGKMAEAEQQYQLALKEKPNDLPALLGYAHLKDRLGKPSEAIQLYQRAAKAHPQQAPVYNDLGLCYARQDRLDEAVVALKRATELDPKNLLYRNNIATVMVDQGNSREAFAQLREAHGDAAAYYNMGYLLNKKGETQAAIRNFAMALKADPSMDAAQRWVEYLQRATAQSQLPQPPVATAARTANKRQGTGDGQDRYRPGVSYLGSTATAGGLPPVLPREDGFMPSDKPAPRRLPPTISRQPALDAPLPGISYESSGAPAAPMPPPSTNAALRPLPRVNY
jgi:tetratricopeptide (TPR) repeat protein